MKQGCSWAVVAIALTAASPALAGEPARNYGVPEGAYTDRHLSGLMVQEVAASGRAGESVTGGATAEDEPDPMDGEFAPVRVSGRSIPLKQALGRILPRDCWQAVIEEGLEGVRISWGVGPRWPEVLRRAADRENLVVHLNYQDCIVAIASSFPIAKEMAMSGGQVWRLTRGATLRETLVEWGERAGWNVAWDAQVDYRIDYPATVVGHFSAEAGDDGVVQRVLQSYQDAPTPLSAQWLGENRVLRVIEKRSKVKQ